MAVKRTSETVREEQTLHLPAAVVEAMRAELAQVAEKVVEAVISEVPSYADPFRGRMGRTIETAVQVALNGFLDLASGSAQWASGVEQVHEAAYALGRGEARSGRSMDALASAYRVGARVAWRDMSSVAAAGGVGAGEMAQFAELVFAYIDGVSDASVAGHADELATTGRVRQRRLERLVTKLLLGDPEEELVAAAERAEWQPPESLTAVLVPESRVRSVLSSVDPATLQTSEDVPGLEGELTVLLVPGTSGRSRAALLSGLRDTSAVVGPARPWTQVRASYERALQARALDLDGDTDVHLATLVLSADPDALADLRARVLAPLQKVSGASREKLTETLRAWLLHHGRRDEIAEALFVHPQTVRYRMGQLRELYGDKLTDPQAVLELTVALALVHD